MAKNYKEEVHFLHGWQISLATLPEGSAIYVVSGCSDRPKETEKVFTDYAAATIWCARQGKDSINFKVDPFTIYRESGNVLTLMKRGVNGKNHRTQNCALKPLKSDREIEENE
jgi:hypothetical protein